jgi:shikimate kinase
MLARPDLAALYERRLAVYARVATLAVQTDGRHPETVTDDIVTRVVPDSTAVVEGLGRAGRGTGPA